MDKDKDDFMSEILSNMGLDIEVFFDDETEKTKQLCFFTMKKKEKKKKSDDQKEFDDTNNNGEDQNNKQDDPNDYIEDPNGEVIGIDKKGGITKQTYSHFLELADRFEKGMYGYTLSNKHIYFWNDTKIFYIKLNETKDELTE